MQSVRDRDRSPPPPEMLMTSHGQCPRGWWCLWMSKRGCLSIFHRVDDVTQAMSKGGGACECSLHPPPLSRKSCIRARVAMSIMLESNDIKRQAYLQYARQLLEHFVVECKNIYGPTFTTYNVHSLIHLHEDVTKWNCSLNDISAFPYENHLQSIKQLVRNGNNPVAPVVKRSIDSTYQQNARIVASLWKTEMGNHMHSFKRREKIAWLYMLLNRYKQVISLKDPVNQNW